MRINTGDGMEYLRVTDASQMRDALAVFATAFDEPETYLRHQPDDAYLMGLLADQGFAGFVAMNDGVVVGALAGYLLRKFEQPRSEFYIYDLAVLADHRRQGIATALIAEAGRYARINGAWVCFVQADRDDPPAIALYSKLGTREDVLHFDIVP